MTHSLQTTYTLQQSLTSACGINFVDAGLLQSRCGSDGLAAVHSIGAQLALHQRRRAAKACVTVADAILVC